MLLRTLKRTSSIKHISIIGAGQMGSGIGIVSAQTAKIQVRFIDSTEKGLQVCQKRILDYLNKRVQKKAITEEEYHTILGRIAYSVYTEDAIDADIVIEAVNEDLALKQKIFKDVEKVVREDTIVASNTSSISITKLAVGFQNPSRFIGMHFFNPVPVMNLVEIIRGIQTSDETVQKTKDLSVKMAKEFVLANDMPGFITNRVLMPWINEAIYALQENVASKEDIDKAMKLGCNVPMGPLTLADFIGLDTCLAILKVLYEGLGNQKFAPCPLLVKYVDAGYFGRKSGKGFYDYNAAR